MLDQIFLQVLNMSFTASYVILFILLTRSMLQKAPKVFSYALWSVAMFRLVCPWSFESALSLLAIGGRTTEQLQPFPVRHVTLEAVRNGVVSSGNTVVSQAILDTPSEPLIGNIFTLLWLLGIAALLLYSIAALFRLQERLRDAVYEGESIYLSKHLSTPFVMGVIRPKIYLPEALSGVEKEYILLHEQIHIRRFDHVIKLVSFFILCIHWFNPLVWLAFFLSGKDMEMSCDEAVIKKLGNAVKKDYSSSLLSLSTGRRIVSGTPLAFGEGDTKGRIKNVLNYKKTAFWIIAVGLAVVVALCIGLAANPKSTRSASDSTEKLWQSRTSYIGDNTAVGNIISELNFPAGLVYDGFALHTSERPYAVTISFKTDTETRNYYTGTLHEAPFLVNACIMFSLIENAECITFSLDDGVDQPYSMQYTSDWAESIVGADLWEESGTLAKFEKLLVRINEHVDSAFEPAVNVTPPQQGGLTFWVKPDEPAEVIGETAASIWLKAYMDESTPPAERIADYEINDTAVISGTPKEGQTWQDMKYHYVVRVNYNITTDSDEYLAPGDGISGKGTFRGLSRELCVKDLGNGSFDIVSVGTGGGEQEFISTVDPLEQAISKAILEYNTGRYSGSDFACESHVTLATEAGSPADNGNKLNTVTVYAMVLYQEYSYSDSGLSNISGSHIPAAITFDIDEAGTYTLKEYWLPRDGSYYAKDIKEKFPRAIWTDALDTQKFILAQIQNCYAQAVEYGKLDTVPVIEKLFETIMSSPAQASNPKDYVAAHSIDYRELTYYGDHTLRYVFSEFLKGGQTGLKGQLMRAVMDDLIGGEAMAKTANSGQEYFDAWLEHGQRILSSIGMNAMRENYPKAYMLLMMLSDSN